MEMVEDIVIIGAGIAGLTTSLGLHRMGLRSVVLESSEGLRVTGFAFLTWTNAWKALDAVGIGDLLRQEHEPLQNMVTSSTTSGEPTTHMSFKAKHGYHEVRCVRRKALLEALEKDLPRGTIRFSSKVVSIEEAGYYKLVHLADGSILKTKVLIGCDGVNSVVAKWLGLQKPLSTGRSATRGLVEFPEGHGIEKNFSIFFGNGFRSGFVPCDSKTIYWFFTYTDQSCHGIDIEDPAKMKQFVLRNLGNVPKEAVGVVERTSLESISSSPLRFRWPLNVLWGDICKGNVCVAGDALHPMTPDLGQGGCAALEDGVVLARYLAEALSRKARGAIEENVDDDEENSRLKKALEKFDKERRWRSFDLISTAYVVGKIQQSSGKVIGFLRDKLFPAYLTGVVLKRADFDCGKLLGNNS